MIRGNTTSDRLRAAAAGIAAGNVADPHGRRVELLRLAADELERLQAALRFYADRGRHEHGEVLEDRGGRAREQLERLED